MSFGRNPYVARAEAAELKAESATDDGAYEQAWREAGRQWDRASDREKDAKRRALYSEKADSARANADAPRTLDEPEEQEPEQQESAQAPRKPTDPSSLN